MIRTGASEEKSSGVVAISTPSRRSPAPDSACPWLWGSRQRSRDPFPLHVYRPAQVSLSHRQRPYGRARVRTRRDCFPHFALPHQNHARTCSGFGGFGPRYDASKWKGVASRRLARPFLAFLVPWRNPISSLMRSTTKRRHEYCRDEQVANHRDTPRVVRIRLSRLRSQVWLVPSDTAWPPGAVAPSSLGTLESGGVAPARGVTALRFRMIRTKPRYD